MILIADVGLNHNADIQIAKELLCVCHALKVDYVKFQKRNPDVCVPDSEKVKPRIMQDGRTISYLAYRWEMEFGYNEYQQIATYANMLGQKWFMSAWDADSVKFANEFKPDYIKIPSAKITDDVVLEAACDTGIPLITSTGGCSIDMVDNYMGRYGFSTAYLCHCTSTYPAKASEMNVSVVSSYRERYPHTKIGFSSHSPSITPIIAAMSLGAELVEFHVTLDRTMWGTDHAASFEPEDIYKIVKAAKTIEPMMGDGEKHYYESEMPVMAKLRGSVEPVERRTGG